MEVSSAVRYLGAGEVPIRVDPIRAEWLNDSSQVSICTLVGAHCDRPPATLSACLDESSLPCAFRTIRRRSDLVHFKVGIGFVLRRGLPSHESISALRAEIAEAPERMITYLSAGEVLSIFTRKRYSVHSGGQLQRGQKMVLHETASDDESDPDKGPASPGRRI